MNRRNEEICGWCWFVAAVTALIIVWLLLEVLTSMPPVKAHDWYSGIRNPTTGVGCCGGNDCQPVDVSRVVETDDEFILDGQWHFDKDGAMPSQDGAFHACIWGGKPRCFFYPMNA